MFEVTVCRRPSSREGKSKGTSQGTSLGTSRGTSQGTSRGTSQGTSQGTSREAYNSENQYNISKISRGVPSRGTSQGVPSRGTSQGASQGTSRGSSRNKPLGGIEIVGNSILKYCSSPKSLREIAEYIGVKSYKKVKSRYMNKLLEEQKLTMTIPDKPTSSLQKYVATAKTGD